MAKIRGLFKKRTFLVALICILVVSLGVTLWILGEQLLLGIHEGGKSVSVAQEDKFFPANSSQHSSGTHLFVYNQKLYTFTDRMISRPDTGRLAVFGKNDIETVADLGYAQYYSESNECFYFLRSEAAQFSLHCFSLETLRSTHLMTADAFANPHHLEDGRIVVAVYDYDVSDEIPAHYCMFDGESLIETSDSEPTYRLGENEYAVRQFDNSELVCIQNGQEQSLNDVIPSGAKSLIPCEGGLLVHNEGQDGLLYFIDEESGAVRELFYVQCMASDSAVNTYGNYAFLSFTRWEKWGDFGMLRFENDTLEGTYRIDICTGETVKISDRIYSGLYIFGDNAIYAVDRQNQIFLLDFDGNVQRKILMTK